MKLPQTTIKNEKTPTVGLGSKVQNILVSGLKTAGANSNPGLNGKVAYSIYEKNSQLESKTHLTPELAIFYTKINIAAGGGKW